MGLLFKISRKGEAFWVKYKGTKNGKITGIVDNYLVVNKYKYKQTITFSKKEIVDIDTY